MCGPSAASIAIGSLDFGSTLLSGIKAQKNAEDLAEFKTKQFENTVLAAEEGFIQESESIRARTAQERAQIGAQVANLASQARLRLGEATAGAASSGVAGQSVADVRSDIRAQRATTQARLEAFQTFREADAARAIRAARTQAKFRILGAAPAPISAPGPLEVGLGAVVGGFQGAAAGFQFGQTVQDAGKPASFNLDLNIG